MIAPIIVKLFLERTDLSIYDLPREKGPNAERIDFLFLILIEKSFFLYRMVFFKKNFEDSLLSKNHCKVRSKPDVSLISASREKPAPPLTHTSCLIVSMCTRKSRFHRRGSVFFVVVSGGGHFQDRPILPEVHDFSDLSLDSLVKFGFIENA